MDAKTQPILEMITQPIIQGDIEPTASYPSVCHVQITSNYGIPITCTGTLIAPDLVLCAAHCVDSPRIFSATCVFGDRSIPAARWFWNKSFEQAAIESGSTEHARLRGVGFDFTILQLHIPIHDIKPSPMMQISEFKRLANSGAIRKITAVGFGRFSKDALTDSLESGQKRSASFKTFSFPKDTQTFKVYPHTFRKGEPVSIGVGDSGGPYFAKYMGVDYLVGTVSTVSLNRKGDAIFATALSVDAPIDFFDKTILADYHQSVGKFGYGYKSPVDLRVDEKDLENLISDENQCLSGICLQKNPILFGALAVIPLSLLVTLTLKIKDIQ